jgi:hypothetical protein
MLLFMALLGSAEDALQGPLVLARFHDLIQGIFYTQAECIDQETSHCVATIRQAAAEPHMSNPQLEQVTWCQDVHDRRA